MEIEARQKKKFAQVSFSFSLCNRFKHHLIHPFDEHNKHAKTFSTFAILLQSSLKII